jgi:hypothetical protein
VLDEHLPCKDVVSGAITPHPGVNGQQREDEQEKEEPLVFREIRQAFSASSTGALWCESRISAAMAGHATTPRSHRGPSRSTMQTILRRPLSSAVSR